MAELSIRMEQYGDYGWKFSVTRMAELEINNYEPKPCTFHYRTNTSGRGLWALQDSGVISVDSNGKRSAVLEYRQIQGTGQFELPANRKAAYGRIRRWAQE